MTLSVNITITVHMVTFFFFLSSHLLFGGLEIGLELLDLRLVRFDQLPQLLVLVLQRVLRALQKDTQRSTATTCDTLHPE